jgi:hypothetical protein
VFWGFGLVVAGGVLLAANLGLVSPAVWGVLWRMWPLVLVLWGVSLLLRPLGRVGAVITAVIVLLAAAGVVGYAVQFAPGEVQSGELVLDQALVPEVEKVSVKVAVGAVAVSLDGTAPEGRLATGRLGYHGSAPEVDCDVVGDRAELELASVSAPTRVPGLPSPVWVIHLNPAPVYTIDVSAGACALDFDLSALKVAEFHLDGRASSVVVTFGDQGLDLTGRVDLKAGGLTLRVPRRVGVEITAASTLADDNLEEAGFERSGSRWVSEGFEAKANRFTFTVDAVAASVRVEWTD